jgi:hypothetical protein
MSRENLRWDERAKAQKREQAFVWGSLIGLLFMVCFGALLYIALGFG